MISYEPFLSAVDMTDDDELAEDEFEDMDDYEEVDEEFDYEDSDE
jgi:hypothetical protein